MRVWYSSTIHLIDDDNFLLHDVTCPVHCGACCDGWRGVEELRAYAHLAGKCPHQKTKGCKLEQSKRPLSCRGYICELALLALNNQVSIVDVQKTIAAHQQLTAFSFLKMRSTLPIADPASIKFRDDFAIALDKKRRQSGHSHPA